MPINFTQLNDPSWITDRTGRHDASRTEKAFIFETAGIFEFGRLVEARLEADERTVRIKSPLTPLYKRGGFNRQLNTAGHRLQLISLFATLKLNCELCRRIDPALAYLAGCGRQGILSTR